MSLQEPDPFRRNVEPKRHATGSKSNGHHHPMADGDRPVIQIKEGEIERIVDEAEEALINSDRGLYQRAGKIVSIDEVRIKTSGGRTTLAQRIVERGSNALTEDLTVSARFERWDARSERWVTKDAPAKVVATLQERSGRLRLPILAGIINAPTMRDDGSILDRKGFDEPTGLFFDPRGTVFPAISRRPSRDDARAALVELEGLFATMPFVGDSDRAVAVSAVLTALTRNAYDTAPMHAITAPAAGSGKSMIIDAATMVATGRKAGVVALGKSAEETEKRLGGALLSGDPVLALDNCEAGVGGDLLCQMLTQDTVKVRPLGGSQIVDLPTNVFVTATGNNLALVGDMTRRAVLCRIDTGVERPELRVFNGPDPVVMAQRGRGQLAIAALTIVRAYALAGRPAQGTPLGSFEGWSRAVRDALVWSGSADPVGTMEEARRRDPRLDELKAIIAQWAKVIGGDRVSTRQVIERATRKSDFADGGFQYPDFREALLKVAGEGGAINSRRLGTWIGRQKDRPTGGHVITQGPDVDGVGTWLLESEVAHA